MRLYDPHSVAKSTGDPSSTQSLHTLLIIIIIISFTSYSLSIAKSFFYVGSVVVGEDRKQGNEARMVQTGRAIFDVRSRSGPSVPLARAKRQTGGRAVPSVTAILVMVIKGSYTPHEECLLRMRAFARAPLDRSNENRLKARPQ
jgi:hypothetical protein